MLDCDNVGVQSIDVLRDRFIESNTAVTFSWFDDNAHATDAAISAQMRHIRINTCSTVQVDKSRLHCCQTRDATFPCPYNFMKERNGTTHCHIWMLLCHARNNLTGIASHFAKQFL